MRKLHVRYRLVTVIVVVLCPALMVAVGQAGAQRQMPGSNPAHSASSEGKSAGTVLFEDVLSRSGISFRLNNDVSPLRYSIETMLGGVAVLDYNNDGLLDIFLTNGAAIPSLEKTDGSYSNRLYRNNGDGTFTDMTAQAGVAGKGYSMGVSIGDYDNDGWEDIYVTGFNFNQLLHNNGDGTFTDVTATAGVGGLSHGMKPWAVAAGWFDYDRDGRLDLIVMNYLSYDLRTAAHCQQEGHPAYCTPDGFVGTPNILYHNNGDGTFTDVSDSSHISRYIGKAMGVAFGDYDGDGYPDIFVSNDTLPNFLLHNNGNGTFTDVATEAGVAFTADGALVAGMGTDFRDLDNDGRPDVFHTAMFGNSFPLYRNRGDGTFDDVTAASGIAAFTRRMTSWGTGIYDFDNDGLKDLFMAGGEILDNADAIVHRPAALPNLICRNRGGMRFECSSATIAPHPAQHRGAAFGDLNNDGEIDAVVNAIHGAPEILLNRTENGSHWIELQLVGTRSNRDGLGAQVKLTAGGLTQWNQATTAVGYSSSSDKRVHFGLGSARIADRIEIYWPSGVYQTLAKIPGDRVLVVTEPTR